MKPSMGPLKLRLHLDKLRNYPLSKCAVQLNQITWHKRPAKLITEEELILYRCCKKFRRQIYL